MDFTCPAVLRQATLCSVLLFIVIMVSCAEVGPPPGGPEDKAAPYIVSSRPASGATDVTPDNSITIFFSERVIKPEGKRTVFISPRPATEPQLKWKSDRLIINLADSFEVGQTYIVSLSTDIVDMRRNRLDKTTTIAFSTGPTIDSGKISGVVRSGDNASPGALVGLYDTSQFSDELPLDSVYAGYLTQTGAGGTFSFDYLPSRTFRLIAFEDRNRDERFSPEREQFAVPDRVVRTGGEQFLDSLNLTLTGPQMGTGTILSASYTVDKMVRVKLSSGVNMDRLKSAPVGVVLRPVSDTSAVIMGQAVIAGPEPTGTEFTAYAGDLAEGAYIVTVLYEGFDTPFRFDSLKVRVREDEKAPEIRFLPDSRPQFLQKLKMTATFSEPLDTTRLSEQTFQLFDQEDKQLPLEMTWTDPLRLVFRSEGIKAGALYRLRVTEFEISDNAGNTMGDSLREFVVTTLDPDSLGTVTGKVTVRLADRLQAPVILRYTKLENRQTFDLPVSGREFKIDLPAGKYLANGFIDIDSSGVRDLGSVVPYRFSETVMTHPDTIAVRARFETAGVEFEFK